MVTKYIEYKYYGIGCSIGGQFVNQMIYAYDLCVISYLPRSTVLFAILISLPTGLNNTVLLMILCPFNQHTVNQQ